MPTGTGTKGPDARERQSRHLKETVLALREELERMRIGEQERLQKGLAELTDENGQLKAMVSALRAALECRAREAQEKIRAVEQAARGEVGQLRETIRTMRELLERDERQ